MSDLISRQDTIDRINEYIEEYSEIDSDGNHSEKWCAMQEAKMTIENMPSAQPEKRTEERTETHTCDLIDRQAAIDVADAVWSVTGDKNVAKVWDQIKDLPSVQPDNQVHLCDSCKYTYPECPSGSKDVIYGNGKGNDNICACNKYEPSAQPELRWIPCSERLPEEYGEFLVTMTEKAKAKDLGFDIDETYIRKMRYNSNGWQLPRHIPSWINEAVKDEVLAWMPLPEPYKEEQE